MNHNLLKVATIFLISLLLIPAVLVEAPKLNSVVVVGSIDPSTGYEEIVNGTTTFLVPRNRLITERKTLYHNITKTEWKVSRVETSSETPGAYYDESMGKYYYNTLTTESYKLSVPDPSGKVTVFSNTIFQNTGSTPKTKKILHPDGTNQSILYVSGQTSNDPYARYLTVKIYNSKYSGGYLVDYTVVASSFNKSYNVTNIVAERDINNVSITLNTYVGKWSVQSYFWVSTAGTDVYVIMIPDVPTWYVSDMDAVRQGVETACMVKPLVHLNTFKGLTYLEVVDMPTYQYITEHPDYVKPIGFYGESGIIVVNAHGEVFPVPSGIDRNVWLDTISLAAQTMGLTWVQVAGYPFYYNSSGSNVKTEVGVSGFQRFLQRVLGPNSIDCWPNQEGYTVPLGGGYSNRLWGYGLVQGGLHESRPLKIHESRCLGAASWTESLTNWTADLGTLYLEDYPPKVGTYDIRCEDSAPSAVTVQFKLAFSQISEAQILRVYLMTAHTLINNSDSWIRLLAPDESNYFEIGWADLPAAMDPAEWVPEEIALGSDNVYSVDNPNGKWHKTGSPSWLNLQGIKFRLTITNRLYRAALWVDGLFLDEVGTNLADLLDVMCYSDESTRIKYFTLGLIGFASPNQILQPDQVVGYYVHNGASNVDSDYNKGKYSMAVAAWTKISILTSGWTDIYYQDAWGGYHWRGRVKCQVAWSYAVPPAYSGDTWKVRVVTSTISYLSYFWWAGPYIGSLEDANAPLKIFGTSLETKFQFIDYQSTTLYDLSQNSWQNTIAQGSFWTVISIILIPFTAGTSWVPYAITIGLGFLSTVTALAFESPSPVRGPDYVDLALKDYSEVSIRDASGQEYRQLQSFGVTEISLAQSANGGASETLTFKLGQKGWYIYDPEFAYWAQGIQTFQETIVVEPRQSADSNDEPAKPLVPSGPTSGYTYATYTYNTSTTDPENDYVKYIFYWGDGTNTITNWYESGATISESHSWSSTGTYHVSVQAQDSQGDYSLVSSGIYVSISTRLTVRTYKIGESEITNRKVWIDSDPVRYSPVTITIIEGQHTVKVEEGWTSGSFIYTFSHWGDGVTSNPRSVNVIGDMTLKAYYDVEYIGTCPTLFVWNGTDYAYEALLDIHAESDITLHHIIEQPLVKDGFFYKLSLRELDEFTSHIDQVKLYATDVHGITYECFLVSAIHSQQGRVTLLLRFDDEIRVDMQPTETIELKFTLPGFHSNIAYFTFEINGHNRKWPGE